MKTRFLLFLIGLFAPAQTTLAHGPSATAGDLHWWQAWNADPVIIVNLLLLSAWYTTGLRRMRTLRAEDATVSPRQVTAFSLAVGCLALALLSPVDVLAAELLWVHMVQHMVLMNLAAPLFVLGAPARVMLWALPPAHRQLAGRWRRAIVQRGIPRYLFWQPVGLWMLYALVLWIWHLPALYEAALRSAVVHDAQHLMFFAVSCLFWRVLFDPIGRLRMARGAAVLYLFLTSLHATVLGVFMALAPGLWYPTYAGRTERWGLNALEDQQLAGYIMWMPACMMYALIAAVLFAGWLQEEETERHASVTIGPPPFRND